MKNQDITIGTLISNMIAKTGENIVIRRFARFQLGEEIKAKHNERKEKSRVFKNSFKAER